MVKFSGTNRKRNVANVTAPIRTRAQRTLTHERGVGYTRDAESDLFLLAATNMVGEDTFYEKAAARDERFVQLVRAVTETNPAFLAGADVDAGKVGLVQYLRETMLMRSAAVVMAAEYVAAGGEGGRSVVARALQRPDEPAEMVGYWMTRRGRKWTGLCSRRRSRTVTSTLPDTTFSSTAMNSSRAPGFSSRNRSRSVNWKTSSTRSCGLVIAWPRKMSMPNDDSTPEMFENRNGLSRLTTVSSQAAPRGSSETCSASGWMSRASRTCRAIAAWSNSCR